MAWTSENNYGMNREIFKTSAHAKMMREHLLHTDLIHAEMRVEEIKAELKTLMDHKDQTDA